MGGNESWLLVLKYRLYFVSDARIKKKKKLLLRISSCEEFIVV
jgi:hypothetical protein